MVVVVDTCGSVVRHESGGGGIGGNVCDQVWDSPGIGMTCERVCVNT